MARCHAAVIRITSGYDSQPHRLSITRLEMIDVTVRPALAGDSCRGDDVPASPPLPLVLGIVTAHDREAKEKQRIKVREFVGMTVPAVRSVLLPRKSLGRKERN